MSELLLFLFVVLGIEIVRKAGLKRKVWENMPTFIEYKSRYPESMRGTKPLGVDCGNGAIHYKGYLHATDDNKIHNCNTCGKHLYKSMQE